MCVPFPFFDKSNGAYHISLQPYFPQKHRKKNLKEEHSCYTFVI